MTESALPLQLQAGDMGSVGETARQAHPSVRDGEDLWCWVRAQST